MSANPSSYGRDGASRFYTHRTIVVISILSALTLAIGCRPGPFVRYVEIVESTRDDHYVPLPVIFIPGIKGTELWKERSNNKAKKLWGLSGHVAFFTGFDDLAFDYGILAEEDAERFGVYYRDRQVYPGDILISYGFGLQWFTFLHAAVYKEINEFLTTEAGFRSTQGPRGRSLFYLPYDWRLDNRVAAVKLATMLPVLRREYDTYLRFWRCERVLKRTECSTQDISRPEVESDFAQYLARSATKYPALYSPSATGKPQIRFNIIAHSMGGLVAQYFIAQLGGHADVHRFVTFGTPSRGAMDALKAFAEGEYPETLWSRLGGVGLYPQRATNYITMSFPAIYQLLPRYAGAISGAVKAEDLGLAGSPSVVASREEGIWSAYRDYRLLPDLEAVGVALGRRPPKGQEAVLKRHLQAQLVSAACFHHAMDGLADPICKEEERREQAVRFLEIAYRGRDDEMASTSAIQDFRIRLTSARISKERPFRGRVVYGGHCHDTVARAHFLEGNQIIFLGSRGHTSKSEDESVHAGDGRVPIYSAQFQRPNEGWRSSFFLCETHLGLIKNESFKYNLMRILLSDFEKPTH